MARKEETVGYYGGTPTEYNNLVDLPADEALAWVAEVSKTETEKELKRRINIALDAGHSEVKVAEAAGVSRPTLRAWTLKTWEVAWQGEKLEFGPWRTFDPYTVALTLTDLPVSHAGCEENVNTLGVGGTTILEVGIRVPLGQKPRTLRYTVKRTR